MSGYCAFKTMGKDELQAISRRAGIASGEARRKKRAAIEREKIENAAIMESQYEGLLLLQQTIRLAKKIR